MGNSIHGVSVNNIRPYHLQLGNNVSIDVTTKYYTEKDINVKNSDVLYTVEGSKCILDLKCFSAGFSSQTHEVWFEVIDDLMPLYFVFELSKAAETNLIKLTSVPCIHKTIPLQLDNIFSNKTKWSSSKSDDTLETNVYLYGKPGKRGGLVVLECKKKSGDENPYLVTLAHYYVTGTENFFKYRGGSIGFDGYGLSVIAKVRRSNDTGLDITVEGPNEHPTTALIYMFDEVRKTGIWKPTTCPHCANIQKQLVAGRGMSSQSDSEDSDNLLLPPRLRAPNINLGRTVNNNGAFRGNFNGSFLKVRRGIFF